MDMLKLIIYWSSPLDNEEVLLSDTDNDYCFDKFLQDL